MCDGNLTLGWGFQAALSALGNSLVKSEKAQLGRGVRKVIDRVSRSLRELIFITTRVDSNKKF